MRTLQPGDEIRVIAPSFSGARKYAAAYKRAQTLLERRGFVVTFGKSILNRAVQGTASIEDRVADFNAAYADKKVKAIFALRGGWSANDILPYIDWELVKRNPKPLIGNSDITVLLNAVLAQAGGVGFLGPNFAHLSDRRYGQVMLDAVLDTLRGKPVQLLRSTTWSMLGTPGQYKSRPWRVLLPGVAEGVLYGGNLGTFFLGQGTPYLPAFTEPFILAVEDDDEAGAYTGREVTRRLESILQLPGARKYVRGIIIGRFMPACKVTESELAAVIAARRLGDVPVIANVDFGHTIPIGTLPLGGWVRIDASGERPTVVLQASGAKATLT